MYIKKSIAALSTVGLLAVGYIAGAIIQFPNTNGGLLSGDINKVKSFNQTDDPEVLAAMEQLASDTAHQNVVALSSAIIATRIYTMDSLTQATVEATEGIEQLAEINEGMKKLARRTQNARTTYEKFMEETAKVMDGKKSAEYEQASNNALLAYTVLENNLASCPDFIDVMAEYLHDNKNEAVDKVAVKWIEYCAEDAVLNQNPTEIANWKEVYNNASKTEGNLGKSTTLGNFPTVSMTLGKIEKAVPSTVQLTIGGNGRLKKVQNELKATTEFYKTNGDMALMKAANALMGRNMDASLQKNADSRLQGRNTEASLMKGNPNSLFKTADQIRNKNVESLMQTVRAEAFNMRQPNETVLKRL